MKLNEVLYKTPEMTEEKLLENIKQYCDFISRETKNRLFRLYNDRHETFTNIDELPKMILEEWDMIQSKKSYLTKSQRDQILGLVSTCLIIMTKENGGGDTTNNTAD